MQPRRANVLAYWLTLAGILLWLGAVVAPPLLQREAPRWSALFYSAFSPVCHQRPERSFLLRGFPMAVCGRCFGIYAGILLGTLVFPLRRRKAESGLPTLRTLAAFTLPIGLDTLGNFLGLWSTGNVVRLATGLVWGVILPFAFIPAVGEALGRGRRPELAKPGPNT
jgi:uncharacterized membrane protein